MYLNPIRFGFLALAIFGLLAAAASAQEKENYKKYERGFCANNWSNGNRVSISDLREITVAAGDLNVDGKRNGGISIKGENRSDVLIRACVQAWANSAEAAQAVAKNVRIETGGTIQANGAGGEDNYAVSYQILVPRNSNLNLTTLNGGISIANVEGKIDFTAKNGGVNLSNLAGDVQGKTANGGLHIELSGGNWTGSGLNVETTNGGVHVSMPENYAARFETRTVNGGYTTDLPALKVERDEKSWSRGVNLSRDINGGGATVRIITTNGGVHIDSSK